MLAIACVGRGNALWDLGQTAAVGVVLDRQTVSLVTIDGSLRTLVSSGACLALDRSSSLGLCRVGGDVGQDLDIRDLGSLVLDDPLLKFADNLHDLLSVVADVALLHEPVGNSCALAASRMVRRLIVGIVLVVAVIPASLSTIRGGLLLQAVLLSLAHLQGPVDDDSRLVGCAVLIAPLLDLSDLAQDELNRDSCVLFTVSVSSSLVVLTAVVYPDIVGDHASAQLVAAEDMRDGLSKGRAGLALVSVQTLYLILVQRKKGRSAGRFAKRLHHVTAAAVSLLWRWCRLRSHNGVRASKVGC